MRKALLLFMLMSMSVYAYSQFIGKGSLIANGAFSFHSTKFKESENKYSEFNIMPWAGYFVMDNLAVGAMVNFATYTEKNDDAEYKSTDTGFLFGPVARYYLNMGVFFHGDFGFGKVKSETEIGGSSSSEFEYDVSQLRFGVGYAIKITDTVYFDPMIGYMSRKEKYDGGDDTETGIFAMGNFTIKIK